MSMNPEMDYPTARYPQPPTQPFQQRQQNNNHESSNTDQFTAQLVSINSRLRILEERFSTAQRKEQVTEQNVLAHTRKVRTELRTIASDMRALRNQIQEVRETIQSIVSEVKTMAKEQEVDVIKKYLNLWDPVQFVTANQAERIAKEVLEDKNQPENQ